MLLLAGNQSDGGTRWRVEGVAVGVIYLRLVNAGRFKKGTKVQHD